jgi:hypothetical protein
MMNHVCFQFKKCCKDKKKKCKLPFEIGKKKQKQAFFYTTGAISVKLLKNTALLTETQSFLLKKNVNL